MTIINSMKEIKNKILTKILSKKIAVNLSEFSDYQNNIYLCKYIISSLINNFFIKISKYM